MADLTWDPADKATFTLSNSNLTATCTTTQNCCRATVGQSTGKWYYSVTIGTVYLMVGIGRKVATVYNSTSSFVIYSIDGKRYGSAAGWYALAYSGAWTVGQVIDITVDLDLGVANVYKAGVAAGSFNFSLTGTGPVYPYLASPGAVGSVTLSPSTGKFPGYTWWGDDMSLSFKKRKGTDIVHSYGCPMSINK